MWLLQAYRGHKRFRLNILLLVTYAIWLYLSVDPLMPAPIHELLLEESKLLLAKRCEALSVDDPATKLGLFPSILRKLHIYLKLLKWLPLPKLIAPVLYRHPHLLHCSMCTFPSDPFRYYTYHRDAIQWNATERGGLPEQSGIQFWGGPCGLSSNYRDIYLFLWWILGMFLDSGHCLHRDRGYALLLILQNNSLLQ